jgi:hypothetical protein
MQHIKLLNMSQKGIPTIFGASSNNQQRKFNPFISIILSKQIMLSGLGLPSFWFAPLPSPISPRLNWTLMERTSEVAGSYLTSFSGKTHMIKIFQYLAYIY